jgi:hypothetical protein
MKHLGRLMAGFYIVSLIFSVLSLSGCRIWVNDRDEHRGDRYHEEHHEEHHDDHHDDRR